MGRISGHSTRVGAPQDLSALDLDPGLEPRHEENRHRHHRSRATWTEPSAGALTSFFWATVRIRIRLIFLACNSSDRPKHLACK
jgi:hypothetical protein